MKYLHVVGARPQFIKAAVALRASAEMEGSADLLLHTGQHYDDDMSDIFFRQLDIRPPDFNLAVGSGGHGKQTGRMLEGVERIIVDEKPDMVVVYGDTNSTLAGALAAVKLHVPVAHVEAGLRSFNRSMPEEINRIAVDHVSDILLAPTETAVKHLQSEGLGRLVSPESYGGAAEAPSGSPIVSLVGDVMYDAAITFAEKVDADAVVVERGLAPKKYALATVHRAENTDDPARLTAILEGLSIIAECMPVVLPLHPRTKAVLGCLDGGEAMTNRLTLVPPVGYLEMLALEKNAAVVLTDSGGVQKEAFFHGSPCVTLRDETEWVELVEMGWNILAGADKARIVAAYETMCGKLPRRDASLYGGGAAGKRIVRLLGDYLNDRAQA